jgi:hypothetical protein
MPPYERPQRARERYIWQLAVVLLDGFAAQHEHFVAVKASLELRDQARLSYA